MNRHGSLIWWLVCIALLVAWVWSFNSAKDASLNEMTRLDTSIPSPAVSEPKPDFQLKQVPEIPSRSDETLAQIFEGFPTEAMNTEPLDHYQQTSSLDEMPEPTQVPFIDLSEPILEMARDQRPSTGPTDGIQTSIINAPDPQTTTTGPDSGITNSNRIKNPFFDSQEFDTNPEPVDPVLTLDRPSNTTEYARVAEQDQAYVAESAPSQPLTTDYANFEDLQKDQNQWDSEPLTVSAGNQFVSGASPDMAPIMPRAQELQSDSSTIQRCVNHIEYGKSLARRGAAYAAREEFYSALRLIAQANDLQTRSNHYTTALRQAITALNEADDFYREIAHDGIDVNVAHVVEAHQSQIISQVQAEGMPSITAIQMYFEFARQRMKDAFGENVVASETLYSLGKLFTVAAAHELSGNPLDFSKSIVMHYAALDSDPNNFKSSNELGVLMARNGRLDKARNLLRDSLVVQRMPQTWRNLAIVHERIANSSNDATVAAENRDLAAMAAHEYELARKGATGFSPKVQWVTPEQFEQTAPAEFNEVRTAQAQPGPTTPPQTGKPNLLQQWKKMF